MLTGVALFNAFDAGGRDAGAWEVQDDCEGHPQNKGEYHYHTLSRCIDDISVHTVIGFALDGFPLTGPTVGARQPADDRRPRRVPRHRRRLHDRRRRDRRIPLRDDRGLPVLGVVLPGSAQPAVAQEAIPTPARDVCHAPSSSSRHPVPMGGAQVSPSTSRSSSVTSRRSARSMVAAKSSAPPMIQTTADAASAASRSRETSAPSAVHSGSRVTTMLRRPGSGRKRGSRASQVLRPMTTVEPVVSSLKWARSSGTCHGIPPRCTDDAVVRLRPDQAEGEGHTATAPRIAGMVLVVDDLEVLEACSRRCCRACA